MNAFSTFLAVKPKFAFNCLKFRANTPDILYTCIQNIKYLPFIIADI